MIVSKFVFGNLLAYFAATLALVQDVGFDQSFSFIYSPRPGTPAADYADDVSPEIKKQRLQLLQTRLTQQGTAISQSMMHTTQSVLITGVSKRDSTMLSGRTENNRVINIEGPETLIGKIINVVVTEIKANTLVGELAVSHYA